MMSASFLTTQMQWMFGPWLIAAPIRTSGEPGEPGMNPGQL